MLRIAVSDKTGVNLSASSVELRDIASRIIALASAGRGSFDTAASTMGDPTPYDCWLGGLRISVASGATCVTVGPDELLRVEGSAECLKNLASFFEAPVNAEIGWHNHFEYYQGNQWIDEKSEPLIISVDQERAV